MTICNIPCVTFFITQYISASYYDIQTKVILKDLNFLRFFKHISKTFLQHTYYIPCIFYQEYSHNAQTKRL